MSHRLPLIATALSLSTIAASPAWALDQTAHRAIAIRVCKQTTLPPAFCDALGGHTANVDRHEWNDPAAHAQKGRVDEPPCDAAQHAVDRVASLGDEAHALIRDLERAPTPALGNALATALGRMLHTVQDSCAHAGMHNDQHAWLSRLESCVARGNSPDTAPSAIACAENVTRGLLETIALAVPQTDDVTRALASVTKTDLVLPLGKEVCAFLSDAYRYRGDDTRWHGPPVTAAIASAFTHGLTMPGDPVESICAAGPHAIDPPRLAATIDVSVGPADCFKLRSYCALFSGKADDPSDVLPPWEDPSRDEEAREQTSGCGMSGQGGPWLMLLALASWRRQRRV